MSISKQNNFNAFDKQETCLKLKKKKTYLKLKFSFFQFFFFSQICSLYFIPTKEKNGKKTKET